MGFQRNTISDIEYLERLNALMPELIKTRRANKQQSRELFFLYNDRLTPRKTSNCGRCRAYVMKRMEAYFNELTK